MLQSLPHGRINHLVGPTHSTMPGPHCKAQRRRGRGVGRGVLLPNQQPTTGVWGALYKLLGGVRAEPRQKTDLVKFEIEKYITDDKDFGNFKKTVIVKMT